MEHSIKINMDILGDIAQKQDAILKKLETRGEQETTKNYVSNKTAAIMFDCDKQSIENFCKEGLIKKYGRGRFIRYSVEEIKTALGIVG